MITTMLMAAALASSTQAPATSVPVTDGNAIYVQSTKADGSTVITGQYRDTGKRFRLQVKGNKVRGWVGGRPVSFGMSDLTAYLR